MIITVKTANKKKLINSYLKRSWSNDVHTEIYKITTVYFLFIPVFSIHKLVGSSI